MGMGTDRHKTACEVTDIPVRMGFCADSYLAGTCRSASGVVLHKSSVCRSMPVQNCMDLCVSGLVRICNCQGPYRTSLCSTTPLLILRDLYGDVLHEFISTTDCIVHHKATMC
ncbi:TPA: hypothetical protein ACH3X1_016444 [Trebouxia sp. C0004]